MFTASFDLLTSVDQLDVIRYILSDSGDLRPPQVRQDLMELHGAVFAASNGFDSYGLEQIETKIGRSSERYRNSSIQFRTNMEVLSNLYSVLND